MRIGIYKKNIKKSFIISELGFKKLHFQIYKKKTKHTQIGTIVINFQTNSPSSTSGTVWAISSVGRPSDSESEV